eukprot:Gb_30874 [translate_table: standard]
MVTTTHSTATAIDVGEYEWYQTSDGLAQGESNIPVIDVSALEALEQERMQTIQSIGLACTEWGFFRVINHGVSASLIEQMLQVVYQFFYLPLEEKMKYASTDVIAPVRYGTRFNVAKEQAQNEVAGLQVRHKGFWVPIKYVPNSFVVNVGDHVEINIPMPTKRIIAQRQVQTSIENERNENNPGAGAPLRQEESPNCLTDGLHCFIFPKTEKTAELPD